MPLRVERVQAHLSLVSILANSDLAVRVAMTQPRGFREVGATSQAQVQPSRGETVELDVARSPATSRALHVSAPPELRCSERDICTNSH
eukprot:1080717-Rhodomonas_salina.1